MNKGELIDKVSDTVGLTKRDTETVITATMAAIMAAVADGDKVTLVGFGSFERRDRKAREGRNPKTGEAMKIPETRVPAFSAGKVFKDSVV